MHLVHITFWTKRPFSSSVTFCKFGFQLRLVARWENERLCPNVVVLPHFAHLAIFQDPFQRLQFPPFLQGHGIVPQETFPRREGQIW